MFLTSLAHFQFLIASFTQDKFTTITLGIAYLRIIILNIQDLQKQIHHSQELEQKYGIIFPLMCVNWEERISIK